jgi:putative hydrolase of the HAD superfamily
MSGKETILNIGRDIQAITFDAVGTLIGPYPSVGAIYAEELGALGYDLDPGLLERNFIKAFRRFKEDQPGALLDRAGWRIIVANALLGSIPGQDSDRVFERLWNGFARPERWCVLSGVEQTLQDLRAAGLRLFVLSNNDGRLHGILRGLPIGACFEAVFVSAELSAEKPSRRIFERVQERIHLAADRILHVGDSPVEDVQGALNAGWRAALVGPQAKAFEGAVEFMQAQDIAALFSG